MDNPYRKDIYQNPAGFSLTHTEGFGAGDSTLQYLHRNAAFLLICFLQGTGSITAGDKQHNVRAGDVVLLSPMSLYRCTVDSHVYHERLVLHISESVFTRFPCDCEALAAPFRQGNQTAGYHFTAEQVRGIGIDILFSELWELTQKPDGLRTILSVCRLMELLVRLAGLLPGSRAISADQREVHPLLPEIVNYLNTHFREEIHLDTIAAAFNLHPSYLSHLFKDGMGTSLWNYVIRLRLNQFNHLLRKTQSVEEACYQSGFQNYANFYRLYRKHMGITPQQYKNQLSASPERGTNP